VTTSWGNVRFEHAAVNGACQTCHNGNIATGKPGAHIPSTNTCDDCHVTTSWGNVRFDHAAVNGACQTCHNGNIATGKPSGHFQTNAQCDDCHRTTGWERVSYSHSSGAFPSGHSNGLDCTDCHRSNSANAAFTTPAYRPDCAGCHANDFEADEHKKYKNPTTVFYRVDELRDCAGSCHEYTDATLTKIKKRRSGEHRASRRDW
jgi:hypothetical protein